MAQDPQQLFMQQQYLQQQQQHIRQQQLQQQQQQQRQRYLLHMSAVQVVLGDVDFLLDENDTASARAAAAAAAAGTGTSASSLQAMFAHASMATVFALVAVNQQTLKHIHVTCRGLQVAEQIVGRPGQALLVEPKTLMSAPVHLGRRDPAAGGSNAGVKAAQQGSRQGGGAGGVLIGEAPYMLNVAVSIHLNAKANLKTITTALDAHHAKLRYLCEPANVDLWIMRLIDFMDVKDNVYENYTPVSRVSRMHLHFWDLLVRYKPLLLPSALALQVGRLDIKANIVPTSPVSVVFFAAHNLAVSVVKDTQKQRSITYDDPVAEGYAKVLSDNNLELHLRTITPGTASGPALELTVGNSCLVLGVCPDSLIVFSDLLAYFINDGDTVARRPQDAAAAKAAAKAPAAGAVPVATSATTSAAAASPPTAGSEATSGAANTSATSTNKVVAATTTSTPVAGEQSPRRGTGTGTGAAAAASASTLSVSSVAKDRRGTRERAHQEDDDYDLYYTASGASTTSGAETSRHGSESVRGDEGDETDEAAAAAASALGPIDDAASMSPAEAMFSAIDNDNNNENENQAATPPPVPTTMTASTMSASIASQEPLDQLLAIAAARKASRLAEASESGADAGPAAEGAAAAEGEGEDLDDGSMEMGEGALDLLQGSSSSRAAWGDESMADDGEMEDGEAARKSLVVMEGLPAAGSADADACVSLRVSLRDWCAADAAQLSSDALPMLSHVQLLGPMLPEYSSSWAERLLNVASLSTLVLDGLGLAELPSELGALSSLSTLSLENNALTALSADALSGSLASLRVLRLRRNRLTEWPVALCRMPVLEELLLDHNALSSLPEEFGSLPALRMLSVQHNQLRLLPENFGWLSTLRVLRLSWNVLAEMPESVGELCELRHLALSHNALTSLPNRLCGMQSIEELLASHNHLTRLPLLPGTDTSVGGAGIGSSSGGVSAAAASLRGSGGGFGQMENIRRINLSHNQLGGRLPEFVGLPNLRHLVLSDNEIQVLPDSVGQLPQLETLVLRHNRLESLPETVGWLVTLRELDVQHNSLAALPSMPELVALKVLRANNNNLARLSASLGQMTSLEELHVSYNRLEELPAELGDLLFLRVLDVAYNRLARLPGKLQALSSLQQMDLEGNPLRRLRKISVNPLTIPATTLAAGVVANTTAQPGAPPTASAGSSLPATRVTSAAAGVGAMGTGAVAHRPGLAPWQDEDSVEGDERLGQGLKRGGAKEKSKANNASNGDEEEDDQEYEDGEDEESEQDLAKMLEDAVTTEHEPFSPVRHEPAEPMVFIEEYFGEGGGHHRASPQLPPPTIQPAHARLQRGGSVPLSTSPSSGADRTPPQQRRGAGRANSEVLQEMEESLHEALHTEDTHHFRAQGVARVLQPVHLVDNHFMPPANYEEDKLRSLEVFPPPVKRIVVRNANVLIKLFGGLDWPEQAPAMKAATAADSSAAADDTNGDDEGAGAAGAAGAAGSAAAGAAHAGRGAMPRSEERIEVSLKKVGLVFETFAPEQVHASRLYVAVQQLEILDRIFLSQVNKLLTDFRSELDPREVDSSMVQFDMVFVRTPAATGSSSSSSDAVQSEECIMQLELLPLQINLDQDAMCFAALFGTYAAAIVADGEYKAGRPVFPAVREEDDTFFKVCIVKPVVLSIDLLAKHVNFRQLFGGDVLAAMGLVSLSGSMICMQEVSVKGVRGFPALGSALARAWWDQGKVENLLGIISGAPIIGTVRRVVDASIGVVKEPIGQYPWIARGVRDGLARGAHTTAVELCNVGATVAILLQVSLETAQGLVGSTPPMRMQERSRLALQPPGATAGLMQARNVLLNGFRAAYERITFSSHSADRSGGFSSVLRMLSAIPGAGLQPLIAFCEATTLSLQGIRNSLAPELQRIYEDKYR
eukprot:m.210385 g.210385  ORF g.210385 m.210385 type:complete len:1906 (+) comp17818_c1_seq2:1492-7209(+)